MDCLLPFRLRLTCDVWTGIFAADFVSIIVIFYFLSRYIIFIIFVLFRKCLLVCAYCWVSFKITGFAWLTGLTSSTRTTAAGYPARSLKRDSRKLGLWWPRYQQSQTKAFVPVIILFAIFSNYWTKLNKHRDLSVASRANNWSARHWQITTCCDNRVQ